MKRKMWLVSSTILLIIVAIFCSFFVKNYALEPKKSSRQAFIKQNSDKNLSTNNTPVEKEKNTLEFKEKLLVDNKSILDMSYGDVINSFGQPNKVINEKVSFPASGPEDYNNVDILSYDGINLVFDLGDSKFPIPIERCNVWSFDLTSDKYNIGDLKVGMSIEEYQNKFTNSKIYNFLDLLKPDPTGSFEKDSAVYYYLKRVLIMPEPKDYYSKYEKVSYQQGVLVDKDGNSVAPLGFGILIKDNKIDRIVYGFPNAS